MENSGRRVKSDCQEKLHKITNRSFVDIAVNILSYLCDLFFYICAINYFDGKLFLCLACHTEKILMGSLAFNKNSIKNIIQI